MTHPRDQLIDQLIVELDYFYYRFRVNFKGRVVNYFYQNEQFSTRWWKKYGYVLQKWHFSWKIDYILSNFCVKKAISIKKMVIFMWKYSYFDKKIEVSLIINNACHNCLIIFDKNKRFWRDKNFPILNFTKILNFSLRFFLNSDAFILVCCQLNNLTD